jgi:hypothetical protein
MIDKLGFIGERRERPGELLARSSPEPPQETSKNIFKMYCEIYIFLSFLKSRNFFSKKFLVGCRGNAPACPLP